MAKTPAAPVPSDEHDQAIPIGKGHATPTRAEQEAARKRPLVPDSKEAKQRARAEMTVKREEARAGMARGEEKFLPARDRGPQRRFVRDYVDGSWHLAEWVMPAMIVVILLTFVNIPAVQVYSFMALWGFIVLVVLDMVYTSWRTKKLVRAKFGETKLEKGTGWYAAMRSMQMRFLRLPKPQVKRGTRVAS